MMVEATVPTSVNNLHQILGAILPMNKKEP